MWLDLHSVQRDKGFERVQGTMHVPGAWPQDWGAPCLFHVLSKGKGSGVLAVLLLVLPDGEPRKTMFHQDPEAPQIQQRLHLATAVT